MNKDLFCKECKDSLSEEKIENEENLCECCEDTAAENEKKGAEIDYYVEYYKDNEVN